MKLSDGLNFPTSIAVSHDDVICVAESGLSFEGPPPGGAVYRVHSDGGRTLLLNGLRAPVNGITWHEGTLFISEGGRPGRISRFFPETGEYKVIVDGLPGFGNYQTNMSVVGPDGKLYFSQGALTNSGVIGPDSSDLPWLATTPHECDIPGYGITLAGVNFEAISPTKGQVLTGPFSPLGTEVYAEQRMARRVPCTAAVMRCNLDGSDLEVYAWGLRNAYGLGFLHDGRLVATEQGADARGSRPVWNCPDFLYEVRQDAWYGWPDFFGSDPITSERFHGPDGRAQEFVLMNHERELPPPQKPLAEFAVNACAVKFVELRDRYAGSLLVALFGDERPLTGPAGPTVGRTLVRISLKDGTVHPVRRFPLRRPIDLAFDSQGNLYICDFGEFEITPEKRVAAKSGTGSIWKYPPNFLAPEPVESLSFEWDIVPILDSFQSSMIWRLDLTNYGHVKANAALIWKKISTQQMPPSPFPPLTDKQLATFKRWMESGFPE